MKKALLGLAFTIGTFASAFACADGGGEDYYYYNLFDQEISRSPQYSPFLMTMDEALYNVRDIYKKNENIEDWSTYLGISYDDAWYLVFKSSKQSIDQLTKTGKTTDVRLSFADAEFISKHRQALLYLSYSKYLEPYMFHNRIETEDSWYYGDKAEKNASQLDYAKVMNVLKRSWNAEADKALKLRYGYQMVRFAHYTNHYKEAISLFREYVVPLKIKTVMYYYALDQKAGAERALGNLIQANYDFFEVFSHTKNKKESAYISMNFTEDLDFNQLLKNAATDQEKMDLYLLIGYKDFSNPLAAMRQIVKIDPNAEQAKILFARAINLVERAYLLMDFNEKKQSGKIPFLADGGYYTPDLTENFLNETIHIGEEQAGAAQDTDFWNLSLAYLTNLSKDFSASENYLAKVNSKTTEYLAHKKMITTLLEVNRIDKITPEIEQNLLRKYSAILNFELVYPEGVSYYDHTFSREELTKNRMKELIKDILANRYFLQGDKAKAFLLHNTIESFANNVQWDLLNDLERLSNKKDKNEFEKYLTENMYYFAFDQSTYMSHKKRSQFVLGDFLCNYKGTLYLKEQKFDLAKKEFQKIQQDFYPESTNYFSDQRTGTYDGFSGISSGIFGYNIKECFECQEQEMISTPYITEFSFIRELMNKTELTDVLIRLSDIARQNSEAGVKANFLLANFYYNTTGLGYFRELLSFDLNNAYGPKFHDLLSPEDEVKKLNGVFSNYYKNFDWYSSFSGDFNVSMNYAKAALKNVNDPELKAQILFTASKIEQGQFYLYAQNNLLGEWYNSYDLEKPEILRYKIKNYRTYFRELKALSSTKAYKEIKSNCLYFNAYVNM